MVTITKGQARADFRAAALTGGRYDQLVEEYSYPLTIFIGDRRTIAPTRGQAWAFFQYLHACLHAEGLTRVTARVTAEDLPRKGRFRLWTDWFGHGDGGRTETFASTVCYCSTHGAVVTTEMVQFTTLSLPMLETV